MSEQLYEYRWNRPALLGRKGTLCRVLVRGKMNSCSIEFMDGFRCVTSRNALRKTHIGDNHEAVNRAIVGEE